LHTLTRLRDMFRYCCDHFYTNKCKQRIKAEEENQTTEVHAKNYYLLR
jgi:hypothetical protein